MISFWLELLSLSIRAFKSLRHLSYFLITFGPDLTNSFFRFPTIVKLNKDVAQLNATYN